MKIVQPEAVLPNVGKRMKIAHELWDGYWAGLQRNLVYVVYYDAALLVSEMMYGTDDWTAPQKIWVGDGYLAGGEA